jgi:DNA-binding transcriptional ArsR family regulator
VTEAPAEGSPSRRQCADLLNELAGLRAFPVPPHDATPDTVHEALRELRGRLDRAEVIFSEVSALRHRARRECRRLALVTDEAYDAALGKLSARAVTREYESIRDREVTARVQSSGDRRESKRAEHEADIFEQSYEAARQMFFGMRDIRAELLTTLDKYLPWRASMEF